MSFIALVAVSKLDTVELRCTSWGDGAFSSFLSGVAGVSAGGGLVTPVLSASPAGTELSAVSAGTGTAGTGTVTDPGVLPSATDISGWGASAIFRAPTQTTDLQPIDPIWTKRSTTYTATLS